MRVRRSLALLVVGTLVPLAAFSAVAVHRYSREQDAAVEQAVLDGTRVLLVALDKHFEATITALKVLGTSRFLDAGDLAAFHAQCLRVIAAGEDWRTISLFDASGRRLLISTEPYGAPLPGPPPAMTEPFRRLVETRTPGVSDLFQSPVNHRYGMSVGVPILRDGQVRWVVSAGMSPDALTRLVASQRVRPDWTATIVDRRQRIVAGALGPESIGESAPASLAERAAGAAEGAFRERSPDGTRALTAFSRSPATGWTASITLPLTGGVIQEPVRAILGVGAVLLLAGVGIAVWAGRRISRPIEALAVAAQRMGRGETVEPVASGVTEVQSLSRALVDASQDRARAEAELARSGERLRILHEIDRGLLVAAAPDAIAQATLGHVRELLGVPRAIVNLFDLEAGEVEWLAAAGRHRIRVGPGVRFPIVLMGDVDALRRGEVQVVDVGALPPSLEADALLASGVRVYMVVPMIAGGELIGALSFGGARAEFPPEQVTIAHEVAAQMAIAIAQARLRERVQRHAEELEQRVRERTAALEAAQEELVRAERLATLGELAGSVAHELRNPLGVIKNSVYYLSLVTPEPRDERVTRHLGLLDREVATADRIIRGLLEFARGTPPERVVSRLDRIAGEALDRTPLAGAVQVIRRTPAVRAAVDPGQIVQVVANLVANAAQAMPDGGTLTIETFAANGHACVRVGDTGVGISAENLSRIFQPLFTTKARGIGLGLAISKNLAEANGGQLEVDSTQGQGSRFTLRFPEAPGEPSC